MKSKRFIYFILFTILFSSHLLLPAQNQVLKIIINGDINPVSAQYIIKHIQKAEIENFECLLIEMDTPGGLLPSTQDIVKEILAANVPVVMYIAPSGAGAVSAGAFITLSCHIAAMAEGTNIGAAHPVNLMGGQDTSKVMGDKVTNYTATWARTIAEKRGRNADWAEAAVRESSSINEKDALAKNVIDLIANNQEQLLERIDGRNIDLENGEQKTLHTQHADVITLEMNWRYKILNRLSSPNIAYFLMILGFYGILFELSNPGSILPGVLGGIFLILAFFALQTLPVRTAGIVLILFSLVLFIAELKVSSFGILTIGGIVAMFLGSIMLFDQAPGFPVMVDWKLAFTIALSTAAFFVFALGKAVQARLTKPTTGKEGLIGEIGVAASAINTEGQILIHGEIWRAESDEKIKKGDKVIVKRIKGLTCQIEKFNQ